MKADRETIRSVDRQAAQASAMLALRQHDPKTYVEHNYWIHDMDAQLRPIEKLKIAQLKVDAALEWCEKNGLPRRADVLKARKQGVSTRVQLDVVDKAMHDQQQCLVIAHDKDTADYLFGIGYRAYVNYKLKKPAPRTNRPASRKLEFRDQEGGILVETAGNTQAGTGLTPHYVHCSEVAKWKKGSETAVALFQSIPSNPNTTVILESTALGYDSLFHPHWTNASKYCKTQWHRRANGTFELRCNITDRAKWNGYVPVFVAWFEDPQYSKPFFDDTEKARFLQTMEERDVKRMKRFNLTPEQMHSYLTTLLVEKCNGNRDTLKQEYPSTPEEAFIVSGSPVFDIEMLEAQPIEEPVLGYLMQREDWDRKIVFKRDTSSEYLLRLYRKPLNGHRYLLAFDPSKGLQPDQADRPDKSWMHVFDMDAPDAVEQVCVLAGHYSEERITDPAAILLAAWYNMAYVVPLVTGGYGTHFVSVFKAKYPADRIYEENNNYGLTEHAGNRSGMISRLAEMIRLGDILFHDAETVEQHRHFKRNPRSGKAEAEGGWHDDSVSAAWGASKGIDNYPINLRPLSSRMIDPAQSLMQMLHRQSRLREHMDDIGGYSRC